MDDSTSTRRGVVRWIAKITVLSAIFALALFVSAGTLAWGAAWLYLGLYVAQQVTLIFILPPDLLAERASAKENTKQWDRLLVGLGALWLPIAIYVVAGLDRRNAWTDIPWVLQAIALVDVVLGIFLSSWGMASNRYFSGTVRIQDDRGHQVVTGGAYRYMRHPGYAGGVIHHLAVPLFLGSWWALIPGLLGVGVLVVRTALEDRTLHQELPGYAEYAQRTRYRLLPGIL
jgi:protein-S-isoprenylcysteine O-methyltransferase Ste14